jgi:uncharacterized membrane protein
VHVAGWDLAFLALGVLLTVAGLTLARSGERIAHAYTVRQA